MCLCVYVCVYTYVATIFFAISLNCSLVCQHATTTHTHALAHREQRIPLATHTAYYSMPHFAAVADSKLLKATSKRNRRRSNAPEPLSDCKIQSDSVSVCFWDDCLCVCVCVGPVRLIATCRVYEYSALTHTHTYISILPHTCMAHLLQRQSHRQSRSHSHSRSRSRSRRWRWRQKQWSVVRRPT